MDESQLEEQRQEALVAMRDSFRTGEFQSVIDSFESMGDTKTIRSGIRVEAISLAARAHLANGSKKDATKLLAQVWDRPLKHHRLYRFLALACLELGDYSRAASLAEKAQQLSTEASKDNALEALGAAAAS